MGFIGHADISLNAGNSIGIFGEVFAGHRHRHGLRASRSEQTLSDTLRRIGTNRRIDERRREMIDPHFMPKPLRKCDVFRHAAHFGFNERPHFRIESTDRAGKLQLIRNDIRRPKIARLHGAD